MVFRLKTLFSDLLLISCMIISCHGPENRQPETAPSHELPEQGDSGVTQPKDGTKVEEDTTDGK